MGSISPTSRLRRSRASLVAVLGAGLVLFAGCGAASTSTPASKRVQVFLVAPTDNATVAVPSIEVLGTVSPEDAVLRISSRRVRVRHGAFKTSILLHRGLTRIRIKARARGFAGSSMTVLVRYAPPRAGTVAPTGGAGGAPSSQSPSQSASANGQSGGGFSGGVHSLGHALSSGTAGRASRCGGSYCGLAP